jgi:hypothetical protein
MGHLKASLISTRMRTNLNTIDGAFVNEMKQTLSNGTNFGGKQCFRGLNL